MIHVKGRVIVIEDDDGMRESLESLLDAAGYDTSAYGSAEALLAAGCTQDARCIVSDIHLRSMSGLELLDTLRGRDSCPPVILITAHDSAALCREAERRGAKAYLPKPFECTALLELIERVARPIR